MASAITDQPSAAAERGTATPTEASELELLPHDLPSPDVDHERFDGPLATELLADLDHPDLVLSDGYVGPERRAGGVLARMRRLTFSQRRSLLSLEFALVVVTVAVVTSLLLTGPGSPRPTTTSGLRPAPPTRVEPWAIAPATFPATAPATVPTTPVTAPPNTAPAPPTGAPVSTPPPAAAPAPAPASAASLTPTQLGAEALSLVRYPWQQIPGYSIQFLPISAAPSPGFYGNTTFTWGHTGGTSVLYVYPGETVEKLAGITAFEIAHEVDAAAVEPSGGQAQIENILNYHPSSWSPDCDCAEQNFLSGWYAAAFSNYWSPGVGNWSQLPVAPPSGATLNQVASWLNPTVP